MNGLLIEMTPVLDSLGWAILHSVWQITLAAMFVWLFYKLTNAQYAKQRYAFSGAMMMVCFLAFLGTLTWYLPIDELDTFAKADYTISGTDSEMAFAEMVFAQEASTDLKFFLIDWMGQYTYWISLAWAIGFLIYAFKYSLAFSTTLRLRNFGILEVEKDWQQRVNELIFAAKANKKTQLKYSKLINSPLTIGFFKPLILVPMGFMASLPPEQVEAVLLHEIAHIKRHDYLINLIQVAIKTVFFYHPSIRYISTKIDVEREHLCDDFAIGMTDDPTSLAKALGFLQLQLLTNQNSFAMNSNQRNHPFLSRLKRLFGNEQPTEKIRSGRMMLPLLLVVAAIFALTAYTEPQLKILESNVNTLSENFEPTTPQLTDNETVTIPEILEKIEKDGSKNRIWERLTIKMDSLRTIVTADGKMLQLKKSQLRKMYPLMDSTSRIWQRNNDSITIWQNGKLVEVEKSEFQNLFPNSKWDSAVNNVFFSDADEVIFNDGKLILIDKGGNETIFFPKGRIDSIPPAPPAPPIPPMGNAPFPIPPMPPALQNFPPMPPMPPMNFNINGDSIANFDEEAWVAYTKEMKIRAEEYEKLAEHYTAAYSENIEKHLEKHEEEIERWSEEVERQAEEWSEKMEEHIEHYEEQLEEKRGYNNYQGFIPDPQEIKDMHRILIKELISDGFRKGKRGKTEIMFKAGKMIVSDGRNKKFYVSNLTKKYLDLFESFKLAVRVEASKLVVERKSLRLEAIEDGAVKEQDFEWIYSF